jgi:hypothetical protein
MCGGARTLLAVAALGVATATPAHANRGVSIDLGRVAIEPELSPGGSYVLPVMGVRNPADEPSAYEMGVSALATGSARPVPEDWVDFSPRRFTLEPGETQPVRIRLDVPTGADPSRYDGLVGAHLVEHGRGAQVGAAAAARVTFGVEPSSLLAAWWLRLKTFLGAHTPWSYFVPAFLLAAGVLSRLLRSYSVQLVHRA